MGWGLCGCLRGCSRRSGSLILIKTLGVGGMVGGAGDKKGTHQAPAQPWTWVRNVSLEKPLPILRLFADGASIATHWLSFPSPPCPSLPFLSCVISWLLILPDAVRASPPPGSLPDLMVEVFLSCLQGRPSHSVALTAFLRLVSP